MCSVTLYQWDTEMLRFVTSQSLLNQELVGSFNSFCFHLVLILYTETQNISKSRNDNFCIAILESKSIIFALKICSSLAQTQPSAASRSSLHWYHWTSCLKTAGSSSFASIWKVEQPFWLPHICTDAFRLWEDDSTHFKYEKPSLHSIIICKQSQLFTVIIGTWKQQIKELLSELCS